MCVSQLLRTKVAPNRTSGPADHQISGSSDHQTDQDWARGRRIIAIGSRASGSLDSRTRGWLDQRASGSSDHRTNGPADHEISGPSDQRTSDQRTSRPIWENCHPSLTARRVGHEDGNDSTSSQTQKPARVAQQGFALLRSHWLLKIRNLIRRNQGRETNKRGLRRLWCLRPWGFAFLAQGNAFERVLLFSDFGLRGALPHLQGVDQSRKDRACGSTRSGPK